VNLKKAADDLIAMANRMCSDEKISPQEMKAKFIEATEAMLTKDIADNKAIGKYGSDAILSFINGDDKVRILTHCNTGSLATAGYGTALGVVRKIHELKRLDHCYCTETRPYNQVLAFNL
jgi:methylthioribose-1-phosphate isomerase